MNGAIVGRRSVGPPWSIVPLVACVLACDGGSHTIGRFDDGGVSIGPAEDGGAFEDESSGGDASEGDTDLLEPSAPDSCSGSAYACVPAAPAGWTGPLALSDGEPVGCSADLADVPGCDADETCMPILAEPFEDAVCVLRDGDLACPGAPYDQKHLFHVEVRIQSTEGGVCESSDHAPSSADAPARRVTVCCVLPIDPIEAFADR